jgi:uncharacterized protein YlxW (UPF0749 family)
VNLIGLDRKCHSGIFLCISSRLCQFEREHEQKHEQKQEQEQEQKHEQKQEQEQEQKQEWERERERELERERDRERERALPREAVDQTPPLNELSHNVGSWGAWQGDYWSRRDGGCSPTTT